MLAEARARRLGWRPAERTVRGASIAVAVVAFGSYFSFWNPNVRYEHYIHRGEMYHHYLGAKYAKELGYTRFYECAAVAETENGRAAQVSRRELRDLRTNTIVAVKDSAIARDPEVCKTHFRNADGAISDRWEAYKDDIRFFQQAAAGDYWENAQKDHGYSAPPLWTAIGRPIASAVGPASFGSLLLLAALDPVLQASMLLLLGWAFGWRVGVVATVFWATLAGASGFYWTGGGFLRHDWLFFLVAALCLLRKRRFALAGAAVATASLLRGVPAILLFGPIVLAAWHVYRHRRFHPDHRRFFSGLAGAVVVLVPLSAIATASDDGSRSLPSRLIEPYADFARHIAVRADTPLTDDVGLAPLLGQTWETRMRFARNDNFVDPFDEWKEARRNRLADLAWLRFGVVAAVAAWIVLVVRRTKLLWVAMAASVPLVASVATLPSYYMPYLLAAAPLVLLRPALAPVLLVASCASGVAARYFYFVDDKFVAMSAVILTLSTLLLVPLTRCRKTTAIPRASGAAGLAGSDSS